MGLLDILNGMQNGPRGEPQAGSSGTGGGMSPLTMAMMGLLAYKAIKSFSGDKPAAAQAGASPDTSAGSGGGLAGMLGALLGRGASGSATPAASLSDMIPGGGAATGGMLMAGLGSLVKDFQDSGHAGAVQSWIGSGPNQGIAPHELEKALGSDAIEALSNQTGVGRSDLLAGLSQHLPQLIDQLTPHGRMPTQEEASRLASAS
jgi:uncharacterized protein YidB (DUF937 family)